MYEVVANMLAGLTALCLWVFAGDYSRVRPWRNPGGRIVMSVTITLAAVMTFISVRLCWGEFPGFEVIRLVVYGGALAGIVAVWVGFRRAQRRGRHRERDHRP